MLHNTGPFGPNDKPVNMGAAVNIPELNSSVNIAENFNNLVKISQQASQPGERPFNLQNYVGYAGSSLSNIPQIHHFQHRHNLDYQNSLSTPNPNLLQSALRQNLMLPENHKFNIAHLRNPMENPFLHRVNNFNHAPDEWLSTPARYFAEATNKRKMKDRDITENLTVRSHSNKQDAKSQQILNNSDFSFQCKMNESGRNVENKNSTVNINHISIEITPEMEGDQDNELHLHSSQYNQNISNNINNAPDDKSLSDVDNDENSESDDDENMPKYLAASFTTSNNPTQDSDPEDMIPLSLTRAIKQEPLDEIETNVVVKVEQVSSWTDTEHMQPFLKDIYGVLREDSSHSNIIDCESSVAEATEMVKNGLTTDYYFECPNCCLLFNHPKRFLVHIKWHSFGLASERMIEEAQDKVGKRRQRTSSTKKIEDIKKEEIKQEEIKQEDIKTEVVKKAAVRKTAVKPATGMVSCKNCDKTFINKTALRNHRHKFHPSREHECKICHKVVLGWFGLKTHMDTHEIEPGFHCDLCPKKFKHAHSLAKHRDTHLEKIHGCAECPKKFGSQKLLKMHMKTHERMLRGPTFSCSYCAKAFYESYTLQVHERTHRNERPYQCQICNTSYGTNSSLKRHMKVSHTHSSSKPFECSTCHRCFVSELIRDRHAAREHGTPGQLQHACTKCTCRYLRLKDLQRHMYRIHPKGKKRRKDSDSE